MSAKGREKLRDLSRVARELQGLEAKTDGARKRRDELMFEAAEAGATERAIAEATNVDPAFVHRTIVAAREAKKRDRKRAA